MAPGSIMGWGCLSLGSAIAWLGIWPMPLLAQITPDTTLPANGRSELEVGGDCIATSCTIIGGSRVGENLFHSFSSFALQNGLEANFSHEPGIVRIFSRITSGGESIINGKLKTTSASLFFLNPEGILFGPQAQIDISKTFVGTSATRILNDGGGQFSGRDFNSDQLFDGAPTSLSFPQETGSIRLTGNSNSPVFNPEPGESLALIGGSISLAQRTVLVPEEQLFLGGFKADAGVRAFLDENNISLSVAPSERVETVTLTETSIVADPSAINGEVRIRADNAILTRSIISTLANQQESRDGNIRFALTDGDLRLAESQLVARSTAGGHSGNISVGNISNDPFNGESLVDSISLNESQILTETEGDGGRIQFANVNGNIVLNNSTIETNTGSNSGKRAGTIFLGGERLRLNSNSRIQTTNRGIDPNGQVGNLNLRFVQGVDLDNSTIATLVQPNSEAAAGTINLNIVDGDETLDGDNDFLELDQGSQIFSETFAEGGDIRIATGEGDLELDNASKIFAIAASNGSFAGNITITAEDLEILGGSQVTTKTPASGGNLFITLDDELRMQQGSLIQTQAGQSDSGFLTISAEELNGANNNQDNDIIVIGPQNNLVLEDVDRVEQFVFSDPPERGNSRSEIGYQLAFAPVEQPPIEQPPIEQPPIEQPPVEPLTIEPLPIEQPTAPSPVPPLTSLDRNDPPPQEPGVTPPPVMPTITDFSGFSALTGFGQRVSNEQEQNIALAFQARSNQARDISPQCRSASSALAGLSLGGRGGVPPMTGGQQSHSPLVDLGILPPEVIERQGKSVINPWQNPWQKLMTFYGAKHAYDQKAYDQKRRSNLRRINGAPPLPFGIGGRVNHPEAQGWLQLSDGRVRLTGTGQAKHTTASTCS